MTSQPSTSLRAREAAQFLGIGESTFWRWVKERDLPRPIRLGPRTTVWPLDKLTAWRDAQANKDQPPKDRPAAVAAKRKTAEPAA